MKTYCQRLIAPNAPLGNPRRVYLEYAEDGTWIAAYEEGYSGLPKQLYNAIPLPEIKIGPFEYATWIATAKLSKNVLFYSA